MYQHYTIEIPKDPLMPGEPKSVGGDVVGIMSNGVLLDSHKQTWAYDSCNGHSDTKGQYHYHIPSVCFMKSFGLEFAESESWWINDNMTQVRPYEEMGVQFPVKGTPSPVVGFALDGFPIYGLYDEAGDLQHGADYGGTVDECNGKIDSDGKYGYYITVDPPFAPSCLKGEIGRFVYRSTNIACPSEGISNKIFDEEDVVLCSDASAATARSNVPTRFQSLSDCDPDQLLSLKDSGSSNDAVISMVSLSISLALLIL